MSPVCMRVLRGGFPSRTPLTLSERLRCSCDASVTGGAANDTGQTVSSKEWDCSFVMEPLPGTYGKDLSGKCYKPEDDPPSPACE